MAMAPPQHWRWLVRLFGPPRVRMREAFAGRAAGDDIDHTLFDGLLRRHVRDDGRVDYEGVAREGAVLDDYLAILAAAELETLGRDALLAAAINAYNAFTWQLVLDHWPLASVRAIPARRRWRARRWRFGRETLSLLALENDLLRACFVEPRLHFAINCAAIGCPRLHAEAYAGAAIDAQLETHCRLIHADRRWCVVDDDGVGLTPVYLWYADDFVQAAGGALAFAARFAPAVAERSRTAPPPAIRWLDYDWSINAV